MKIIGITLTEADFIKGLDLAKELCPNKCPFGNQGGEIVFLPKVVAQAKPDDSKLKELFSIFRCDTETDAVTVRK